VRIRPGEIKIIVGDPIDTTPYSEADKDLLVKKVRDVIADTLQRSGELCRTGFKKMRDETGL